MAGVNEPTPSRPRQVTLAAWLIMVGSVVMVAMVFDRVAGLHTIETQDSVRRFLAEPPADELGLGVDGVITALRIIAMVAAGCATAAAILGYQVLRRSRGARIALTVLAVPLFLAGMVTGGFVSSVVAASAVMLWLQPSRSWFDGGPAGSSTAPASAAPVSAPARPVAPTDPPVPAVPAAGASSSARRRPAAVVLACVLTWVFSALTAVAMIASAVAIALRPGLMVDEVHRQNPQLAEQGISDNVITAVTYVMAAAIVIWCLAAVVAAVLVVRRVAWARIVLIVSAATCAALCLVGCAVGGFLLAVPLVAAVATIALLARPDAGAWFGRSAG